eukprot:SAG22_NODE_20435_length_265_cov_2.120482_1_plen_60_part_10
MLYLPAGWWHATYNVQVNLPVPPGLGGQRADDDLPGRRGSQSAGGGGGGGPAGAAAAIAV